MKTWTATEMHNVVDALKPLLGLRLQEVQTSDQDLVLGFYAPEGLLWLWVDLNPVSPCLLPWTQLPSRFRERKTPLNLFLRANFLNHSLRDIEFVPDQGRVVNLIFTGFEGDSPLRLELRLFPHGRNVLATASGKHGPKQLAWQKPTELAELPQPANDSGGGTNPARDLQTLREEWLRQRSHAPDDLAKKNVISAGPSDLLVKKRRAVVKVREELELKRNTPWAEVGQWLKAHLSLEVPSAFAPFVDKRRKVSWNMEHCFAKARELEGKIRGTEARLGKLTGEIAILEAGPSVDSKVIAGPAPRVQPNLASIEAQGRTLQLGDGLTAVTGKSADDNLKILRKARAWDLWFHMRDFPSSHAILFRGKNASVADAQLLEVAAWCVRHHLKGKTNDHRGEKFDIVMVECRHVRTIKGDKKGRVTYHHERVITYQIP